MLQLDVSCCCTTPFDTKPFERVVVPNDFPCNELHSTAREIFAIPASVKTELRMMPSNVIVAEGFTLLSSDAMDEAGTSAVAVGDAGVTNGAVVQLFFLPNTPSADPYRAGEVRCWGK